MTEELRAKLESLKGITARLNKATDDANGVVARVDKYLGSLGVGISGEGQPFACEDMAEKDEHGDATDETFRTLKTLAYGRLQGTFQIHVLDQTRKLDEGYWQSGSIISSHQIPWGGCSREMKLLAIPTLPSLLEDIIKQASALADKAEAAASSVAEMMNTLDRSTHGDLVEVIGGQVRVSPPQTVEVVIGEAPHPLDAMKGRATPALIPSQAHKATMDKVRAIRKARTGG